MPQDFGNGVSRVLPTFRRQYEMVVYQSNKPWLDSETNLTGQIALEKDSQIVRTSSHSGFLSDTGVAPTDYITSPAFSNYFYLGNQNPGQIDPVLWASVNGWLIPVTGVATPNGDTRNKIELFPPPSSDTRTDFVFLEVWQAQIAPNPSTVNKPSASTVWAYGNTMFGGTNEPDDIEDPAVGFETTERVQLQYRIRVYGSGSGLGASVDLAVYPDGLDDPNVVGQGTASSPLAGFRFHNMRGINGDPGLWRAGDGDPNNALGTVDGYVYAIPIASVFRRNTQPFVAATYAGNANQQGALNRNPSTVAITTPSQGARLLGTATLGTGIAPTTTGPVVVSGLIGSALDNPSINWNEVFIVLDGEILSISSVNTGTGTMTIRASGGRGRFDTQPISHSAGTKIEFFNTNPNGWFADQITDTDILDMRRSINLGDWDHNKILAANLTALFKNQLRTSYKQSGVSGGDVQGVVIPEVDYLFANGGIAVPNQTQALDGCDGIRTTFSDASVLQSGVTTLLAAPTGPGAVSNFTSPTSWDVGAGFVPDGFGTGMGWRDGDVINLYIGGQNGNAGARRTSRNASGNRVVRFITPKEYWSGTSGEGLKTPVFLRFLGSSASPNAGIATEGLPPGANPDQFPGPVYPLAYMNFEKPYIVLGGIVNTELLRTGVATAHNSSTTTSGFPEVALPGIDFDAPGVWFGANPLSLNPDDVGEPLLHGTRTLFDMLTSGGKDFTGSSSELYLVLTGDVENPTVNNGVFRIIAAGTNNFTTTSGSAPNRVVVEFIRGVGGPSDFTTSTGGNTVTGLTAVVRSQYTSQLDDDGRANTPSALCVVLTDISATTSPDVNPWSASNLGVNALTQPIPGAMQIDTTLQYSPSRGGTARVADRINRVAVVSPVDTYIRTAPGAADPAFASATGMPTNELYFSTQSVQVWNRLPSLGLQGPFAPSYGGGRVGLTDQSLENEVFTDTGSKTLVFRPFLLKNMTLTRRQTPTSLIPAVYPVSGNPVDAAGIFSTSTPGVYNFGYAIPAEYMPRFGRQDIPFRKVNPTAPGASPILFGINHMFNDSASNPGNGVFSIIGGPNPSAAVSSMFIQTGASSGMSYGEYGPLAGGGFAYQGRLFSDVNIRSTDLGWRMQGIQLPPFLGVARVYAVYDRRDYISMGSSFLPDRINPRVGGAPNLLRQDVDQQTIYILQGGGEILTSNPDDHTYIIPSNVIDPRLSASYIAGEDFIDLEYVVEFTCFGFARGFINKNNFVMSRTSLPGGASVPNQITSCGMILPSAPSFGTQVYVEYIRTVYQGDPYMTRNGATRTTSDYSTRYGVVPVVGAADLAFPIQQYSFTGEQIPEKVNPRALEVLAHIDFYTTLGTGKMGGFVYPGTITDIGGITDAGIAPTRIPESPVSDPWAWETRVFTQGQPGCATRGGISISIVDNASLAGEVITLYALDPDGNPISGSSLTLVAGVDFAVGINAEVSARNAVTAIQASDIPGLVLGLETTSTGAVIEFTSLEGGSSPLGRGVMAYVRITPASGLRSVAGLRINIPIGSLPRGGVWTQAPITGGVDSVVNAVPANTPLAMQGLTERLPLGILVQDSDFLGEDPLRNGLSALYAKSGVPTLATSIPAPFYQTTEYERMVGGSGQYIALSDGAVLVYTPYDAVSRPTGTRKFRIFRGGGSAYMVGTQGQSGGPVEWEAGDLPDPAVLKGAVLAGRAFLVRNYRETAFAGDDTTSYGDELQMVILTRALYGEGTGAYTLAGQISPTGYGEGYCAADRYRLMGLPLDAGHSQNPPDVDVPLAPYPNEDPSQPCPPCLP
jgi:hypothetical protein